MHDCSTPLGIASGWLLASHSLATRWPLVGHLLSSFKDISGLHMRVSLSSSRPINQTCSEHTHSPHPPSTAFPPPFCRRCPCSRPCLRLQRLPPVMCPEPNGPSPPLLARDSDGFGAAPEEGPRGLNTHPPELAPGLDSRQLVLRSKASNAVLNQKGASMSQRLRVWASMLCFFGLRSRRL